MALRDVAIRLYNTQNLKSASLTKNIKEAYKQNIAFRFSLLGMAATLLRSETLKELALSKFVAEADLKEQLKSQKSVNEEESRFKSYVLSSIKTLSNQVNILTAVSEKNTAFINMMMNDMGYFKNQRKVDVLNMNGSLRATKIPVRSKTIKGQLDLINQQIQEIKKLPGGVKEYTTGIDPRIAEAKQRRKKEDQQIKAYVAASVAAILGGVGVAAAAGGGPAAAKLFLGSAGVAGAAAIMQQDAAQEILKRVGGFAVPAISSVLKVSLMYNIAKYVAERQMRRFSGEAGFMFGEEKDYVNKEVFGTPEYYMRQQEIQIRKTVSDIAEPPIRMMDNLLTGVITYLTITGGAKFIDLITGKRLSKSISSRRFDRLGMAAPTAARAAAASGAASSIGAAASAGLGGAAAGGMVVGNRVWNGKMWKTLPTPPTPKPMTPLGAAPKATRIKRFLPRNVMRILARLNHGLKSNLFMRLAKTGAASIAILGATIMDMYSAAAGYEQGNVSPEEYKSRMVNGWQNIISIVGVTGVSAVVGGAVGGLPGILVGAGAGAITAMLMADTTESAAEKIFDLIHKGVIPTTADIDAALSASQIEQISVKTRTPAVAQSVLSEDAKFANELMRVSAEFMIDPADLLSVMLYETAGTLDPSIKNPNSSATGLIQFTEATAKTLGTTTAALSRMSRAEQMVYVEKYFKHHKLPIGADIGTIYSYVFLPGIARTGSNVLAVAGHEFYEGNKSLDINKDGVITVDDLAVVASGRKIDIPSYSPLDSLDNVFDKGLANAIQIINDLPTEKSLSEQAADDVSQLSEETMAARIESRAAMMASTNLNGQMRAVMKETISNREYLKQQIKRPIPVDQTVPA